MRRRFLLIAVVLSTALARAVAAVPLAAEPETIQVEVRREADTAYVDAAFFVPVPRVVAWSVLTDYERMPVFMPDVNASKVLQRSGNKLRVSQTGTVYFGPIPIPFEYLREVELTPSSAIRSVAIGGSVKSGIVETSLLEAPGGTRIVYRSEGVPTLWLPFGLGESFIRKTVKEKITATREEMVRRHRQLAPE